MYNDIVAWKGYVKEFELQVKCCTCEHAVVGNQPDSPFGHQHQVQCNVNEKIIMDSSNHMSPPKHIHAESHYLQR